MARYIEGMSKNQKRRVRLNDRLALAMQDATTRAGEFSGGLGEEPPVAAPRVPAIENILDSESEAERQRQRDEKQCRGRGKSLGRGAKLCVLKPKAPASSAKRPAEMSAAASASSWLDLPAAQRARIKQDKSGRLAAQMEPEHLPPWRVAAQSSGEKHFWSDGKRIVPRWEVEATLRPQFDQTTAEPEPDYQLLSKAGTQLLRWGRTDLRAQDGSVTTLVLPKWEPDAWVPLLELADVLGVGIDVLQEALPSTGRRGDRVEILDGAARALWHQ